MKDARCIFVCGMRGSGKSTLVQSLVARSPRVVAFDPTGEYGRPVSRQGRGWPLASSLDQVHGYVSANWRAPAWRVALTVAGDFVGELHKLSVYLWGAMQHYETGRDRKMLTLVVEEMDVSVPNHRMKASVEAFKRLTLQGRHRGVEIVGVTQHPAQVPVWFRVNCLERYVFALGIEDHSVMGARHRDQVAALTTHHYLRFAGGDVSAGENRLVPALSRSSRTRGA